MSPCWSIAAVGKSWKVEVEEGAATVDVATLHEPVELWVSVAITTSEDGGLFVPRPTFGRDDIKDILLGGIDQDVRNHRALREERGAGDGARSLAGC